MKVCFLASVLKRCKQQIKLTLSDSNAFSYLNVV